MSDHQTHGFLPMQTTNDGKSGPGARFILERFLADAAAEGVDVEALVETWKASAVPPVVLVDEGHQLLTPDVEVMEQLHKLVRQGRDERFLGDPEAGTR